MRTPNRLMKNFLSTGALLLMIVWTGSLSAALTPVANPNGGEPNLLNNSSQTSVMNTLYGAGNYTRIDDSIDQLWTSQNGTTQAEAKFAGNNEVLGYYSGASGGAFQALYTVGGNGYSVSGSSTGLNESVFRWGLQTGAAQGSQFFSSLPTENLLDGANFNDHMVTFLITGNAGTGFSGNPLGDYVIAFEDLVNNPGAGLSSDRDFNDAVFQLSGTHNLGVPEPSTYLTLGSILALATLARRRQVKHV